MMSLKYHCVMHCRCWRRLQPVHDTCLERQIEGDVQLEVMCSFLALGIWLEGNDTQSHLASVHLVMGRQHR